MTAPPPASTRHRSANPAQVIGLAAALAFASACGTGSQASLDRPPRVLTEGANPKSGRLPEALAAERLAELGQGAPEWLRDGPDAAPPVSPPRAGSVPPGQAQGIESVSLWCEGPADETCRLASAALGVPASRAAELPPSVFRSIVDLDDDCLDPDVAELMGKVSKALFIDASNWHDNGGVRLDAEDVPQTFSAAGCTNCCWDDTEPPVKVHKCFDEGGVRYLVRVWKREGDADTRVTQASRLLDGARHR